MKKPRLSLIIGICTVLYIMSYFHRVTPTILSADLQVDFQASATELGIFSSAALLAYGMMQLPSGMLTDLFGGRRVLMGLSVLTGLGTLWFASCHSFDSAFGARFLTGIGAAVTVPIIAVLAQYCPPNLFVRISSFILATAGIGGIVAAPPLLFLSEQFGWRNSMAGFGIFSIALTVAVFVCLPKAPSQSNTRKGLSIRELVKAVRMVFTSKIFWTLAIWYMMVCGASFCMSTLWWGPYLMKGLGVSKEMASSVISGISVGVLCSFFLLGAVAGTVFKNLKAVLLVCTVVICGSLGVVVFGSGELPILCTTVAAALFTGFGSAVGPITYSLMKDNYPPVMAGTAVGVVNMTYPIWSSILQYLYGFIVGSAPEGLGGFGPHDLALGFIFVNCCVASLFLIAFALSKPSSAVSQEDLA